jgi:hypothetical protein
MAKGSIIVRGNSISVKVSYKDSNGQWRQVWKAARSKTEADKLKAKLLVQVDEGNYKRPTKETVADFLKSWLNAYAKIQLTPRSYERYESIVRVHLIPAVGKLPLSQLRSDILAKLYSDKVNSGLSPGRQNTYIPSFTKP